MAHVLAVADHAPETAVLAGLMNEAGIYLRSRVQLRSTEELLERALEIKEAAYGPDHPEVAITLGNLGLVLKDLGDLGGALLLAPRPRGKLRVGPARPATHRQLERKWWSPLGRPAAVDFYGSPICVAGRARNSPASLP